MNTKKTFKEIGKKLRDETNDIVKAKLPKRLAELVRQLDGKEPPHLKAQGL